MKPFLVFVSIFLVTLCGFPQKSSTVDAPFEVLSYSVQRLPYRPRLVAFSTPDASISGPSAVRAQSPSSINASLQRERESRRRSAESGKVDRDTRSSDVGSGEEYQYRMKARNNGLRVIERVFWQYETVVPGEAVRSTARQFLCGNRVKPSDTREFSVVTPFAPSNVVSVAEAGKDISHGAGGRAVVNRIEYADGTSWENPNWGSAQIKLRLNDEVYRTAKGRCVVL